MALTTLDTRIARLVIDLQQDIVALPAVHPLAAAVRNARALADALRDHGLPVVLVNVAGGAPGRTERPRRPGELPAGWADRVAEPDRQPQDPTLTKHTWGAFTGTDLAQHLKQQRTRVVFAGVATRIGVESSARQAHEPGFNVALAIDAMTDMSAEAQANSVARIFPRPGETGTTREITERLACSHAWAAR